MRIIRELYSVRPSSTLFVISIFITRMPEHIAFLPIRQTLINNLGPHLRRTRSGRPLALIVSPRSWGFSVWDYYDCGKEGGPRERRLTPLFRRSKVIAASRQPDHLTINNAPRSARPATTAGHSKQLSTLHSLRLRYRTRAGGLTKPCFLLSESAAKPSFSPPQHRTLTPSAGLFFAHYYTNTTDTNPLRKVPSASLLALLRSQEPAVTR